MKKTLLFSLVLFLFIGVVNADTCTLTDTTNGFCLKGIDINQDEIEPTNFFAEELADAEKGIKPGRTFFKVSNNNKILYCANGTLSTNRLTDTYEEIDRDCFEKNENKKNLIYSYVYGYHENKENGAYSYNSRYLSGEYREDYYITQTAIWNFSPPTVEEHLLHWGWFSNYNFQNKTYYGKTDETITKISNLINDATAATNAEPSLKITAANSAMNISQDGRYYVSEITINGRYLNDKITATVTGNEGIFVTKNEGATTGNTSIDLSDGTNPSVSDKIYVKVPVSKVGNSDNTINLKVSSKTVFNGQTKIAECRPQKIGLEEDENGTIQQHDDQQPMVNFNLVYTNLNDSISLTATKFPVKISKETNNGTILKGAKLELKQGENIISTWDTDNNIKTELLAPGEYTLSEINAPDGYIRNNNKIIFHISNTGVVSVDDKIVEKIVIVNNPITIKVSKRKKNEDFELSGATLRITDKQGNIIKDIEGNSLEWVTSNEPATFHIAAGTYIIEETNAPNGYELSDKKIEFTVDENGKVTMEKGILKKEILVENNFIIFENTPEPEQVQTGSIIIYIAIVVGILAIGIVTLIILKKYKK